MMVNQKSKGISLGLPVPIDRKNKTFLIHRIPFPS